MNAMTHQDNDLSVLLSEIKEARVVLEQRNASIDELRKHVERQDKAIDELRKHVERQDKAIDALAIKMGRPSGGGDFLGEDKRKSAIALLETKNLLRSPKRELGAGPAYRPTEEEIVEAEQAISATKNLFKMTEATLDYNEKKALSSFALSGGMMMSVEQSNVILNCLDDQHDISSLVTSVQIGGSSGSLTTCARTSRPVGPAKPIAPPTDRPLICWPVWV